jgi:hypothetical protein
MLPEAKLQSPPRRVWRTGTPSRGAKLWLTVAVALAVPMLTTWLPGGAEQVELIGDHGGAGVVLHLAEERAALVLGVIAPVLVVLLEGVVDRLALVLAVSEAEAAREVRRDLRRWRHGERQRQVVLRHPE